MAITINGTTGIAGVDGSASTPAVQGTDTNTGIFFPAADTIAFGEGGSEVARFNSSGQLGIGTTAPAIALDVRTVDAAAGRFSRSGTSGQITSIVFEDGSGTLGSANTTRIASSSGYLAFSTGGTSGDTAGGTERARITSGGEVYIAGTTDQGAYNLQCNGTGVWGAGAYVNGSDARIKDDIAPIESGLDVVEKLNPVTYRYKEDWLKDQSTQTGFIAQELLVALEGKNYVDGVVQQGGAEGYYSVAYQNIIPILTKAIQELKAELDTTKARLAALEAK